MPRGEVGNQGRLARELGRERPHPCPASSRTVGQASLEILDELRADLAKKYLGDKSLSLAEVAYLLGYADGQRPSAKRSGVGRVKTPNQMR